MLLMPTLEDSSSLSNFLAQPQKSDPIFTENPGSYFDELALKQIFDLYKAMIACPVCIIQNFGSI